MRWTKTVALAAAGTLVLGACSGGSGAGAQSSSSSSLTLGTAFQSVNDTAIDPTAQGPAPAIPNAVKGGTLTIPSTGVPETFDPTAQWFQDATAIDKLVIRSLTAYRVQNGRSVLVPDLAESWTEAPDKLSWTFKIKKGIKYEDGSTVTAKDFVYGIKRSFATEELPGGPQYAIEYLKGGGTADANGSVTPAYLGPWKDKGKKFEGAEAIDDHTLRINLRKAWPTLPYYAAFTQMSPIPEDKDTKLEYRNHPLATGPYKFDTYVPGTSLKLVRNDQWDAASDPARHQNVDAYQFQFGMDATLIAKTVMASSSDVDKTSLSYAGVPAEVFDDASGPKANQVVTGTGPCVEFVSIDTRKVPDIRVRRAIAAVYPVDMTRTAGGWTSFDYEPASTFMVPSVPGFTRYAPVEFLAGQGDGDVEKAKALLKEAGAETFELSWYFIQDSPTAVKVNQARIQGLQDAGFHIKAIGKTNQNIRGITQRSDQPVNLMQGPQGWCFDWPAGDSVYPALFSSLATKSGNATGYLSDPKLDKEMDRIKALPIEQQGAEWSKFDENLMRNYVPAIPTSYSKGAYIFGTRVKNVQNDPNQGMPDLSAVYIAP